MKKHYKDVSRFLSVLEIGAWKVKCCLPANQITSVGAIGPFGMDTSSEELTEALIDAGFGGVTVERIYKGKEKIVTAFFKVVFNTTTLPQFVRSGYQEYRVSTYIGKPWQYFCCQRFGHNAVNCRAAPRCVVCSGAHNSRKCPSPSTRSCCNCSGNHTANHGGCPKIRQARKVEKIRQIQKLSYRDAARQVLYAGGTSLVQPHSDQTLNISMVIQSGGKDQYSFQAQPTKLVSVGTQTGDEIITPTSPNVIVTQLVELLARTLSAVTRQDENLNLKDLIIEIAKDTFKSQVLNTSANNERPLTAQPQHHDCSDPSNLMTTLDLPTIHVTPSSILGRPNPRKNHKTNAQTSSSATKNKSLHTSEKYFHTMHSTKLTNKSSKYSDSKANVLADHFKKSLGSPPPTPFPQFVLLPLALALSSSVQSPLNEPFTTDAFNTVWPTGVLYKLGSCGVLWPILRWLHSYLTNLSFQVYFEGSYASVRRARSGVPQGGILSPMLFNLMMSDIPIQSGVQLCEYADDLTFFTAQKDLHVATDKLQTQMESLNKWLQQWGFKINCTKTKTMCFTIKKVTPLPISLCG
ncbi:Reverse transcriptase domain [Trinorchestia longiramus]|nr:Reverse transcriptase domain [Trinorchestia longiramus]